MCLLLPPAGATDLYVAADGAPSGNGTIKQPYDLESALSGRGGAPGDTFWLRGGTYSLGHVDTRIHGEAGSPITFRAMPGERPRVDGSITLWGSSGHLVFRDFELFRSDPKRVSNQTRVGFNPTDIEIISGLASYVPDCSFIDLVVHDQTRHGIYISQQSNGSLIHGCIIYNNGWRSPDNAEGHSLYIQGSGGSREISDNVLFNSAGAGMHAYDNGGPPLVGVTMDGNVAFNAGALQDVRSYRDWIVGVDSPSSYADEIVFRNNMGYLPPGSSAYRQAEIGRQGVNGKLTMTGNYLPLGLLMKNWTTATVTENTLAPRSSDFAVDLQQGATNLSAEWHDNIYFATAATAAFRINSTNCSFSNWTSLTGFDSSGTDILGGLSGTKVFVRPNRYENGRASIVVYNWNGLAAVPVDVGSVLPVGTPYEVRNAEDYFAAPVLSGVFAGLPLLLPMEGLTVAPPLGDMRTPSPTGPAFNVFVLLPLSNSTNSNAAPTITPIESQTIAAGNSSTPVPFTVNDSETSADNLLITVRSSNTALLPNSGIVLGGSGGSRTVTVSPAPNRAGLATVTVAVSDGSLSSNTKFDVTVNSLSTITLTSPEPSSIYTAPADIELAAEVTANGSTIAKVAFYEGAMLLGEDTTAPYQFTWRNVMAGSYSLNARAVDAAGHETPSQSVIVAVTTPPPSSGLSLDARSGVISAPFAVTGGIISQPNFTGVTAGGRAAYEFTLSTAGDYLVSTLVNAPDTSANSFFVNIDDEPSDPLMIWDIPVTSGLSEQTVSWRGDGTPDSGQFSPKVFTLTAGTHQLIVRGREGNCQLGTITFAPIVTTEPPVITLTEPMSGAGYVEPATIELAADVAANGHVVKNVQFRQGSTLLGEIATAPYRFAWNNVLAGNYDLSAQVVYDTDKLGESPSVNVTVATLPHSSGLALDPTTGEINAPFVVTNGTIYQPAFTGLSEAGRAVYDFMIANAGNYIVSALANAPSAGANSYYVNVDAEPADPTTIWDIPITTGFAKRTVTWRGNGLPDSNRSLPKVFTLAAGQHQLIVCGREADCELATIVIEANTVPYASIQTIPEDRIAITWFSDVGTAYRVLFKNDWAEPWTSISGVIVATNTATSWMDNVGGSSHQRFYMIDVAD